MAIPDAGCGEERLGFSWQCQTLVVWFERRWVLMAVPEAGCWGERRGSHGISRCWLWGREAGVLMAVPIAGRGRGKRGL